MNQKIKYYLPIISSLMIQSCSINTNHSKEIQSVVINRKLILQKQLPSNPKFEYYLMDLSSNSEWQGMKNGENENRRYMQQGEKLEIVNIRKTCFDGRGWINRAEGYFWDKKNKKNSTFYYEWTDNDNSPPW
jgi:hypothetical protein